MTAIEKFIHARLGEDQRTAERARSDAGEHWPDGAVSVELDDDADSDAFFDTRAVSEHVTRHDPARVLLGVEAKRKILDRHHPVDPAEGYSHSGWLECAECGPNNQGSDLVAAPGNGEPAWFPCLTLRDVASEWSEHPDYRQEWRP